MLQPPREPIDSTPDVSAWEKGVKAVLIFLVSVVAFVFVGFLLLFWGGLAWIAYWPLPDVPRREVEYTVTDAGSAGKIPPGRLFVLNYEPEWLSVGWRITEAGTVVLLTEEQARQDDERRQEAREKREKQYHLSPGSDAGRVFAAHPQGNTLMRWVGRWFFSNKEKRRIPISGDAHGYTWPIHFLHFHQMNGQGVVIGNGRICTATASSGGTSSPHGRWMPLVWRKDRPRTEDLNSRIAADSGWYISHAIDINEGGQILGIGHRTDARGAETRGITDGRLVILTPRR